MKKRTRYSRTQIEAGTHHLGESASFLRGAKYSAVSQHCVHGKHGWYVEVGFQEFEKLLGAKKLSLKRKRRSAELQAELTCTLAELGDLRSYCARLEINNAKLLENIEKSGGGDRFKRSPKSYLNVIQERAATGVNPLPIQGGLAGLEKKG